MDIDLYHQSIRRCHHLFENQRNLQDQRLAQEMLKDMRHMHPLYHPSLHQVQYLNNHLY